MNTQIIIIIKIMKAPSALVKNKSFQLKFLIESRRGSDNNNNNKKE